jgi:hypothetical protein
VVLLCKLSLVFEATNLAGVAYVREQRSYACPHQEDADTEQRNQDDSMLVELRRI